jgi:hypothetical protein
MMTGEIDWKQAGRTGQHRNPAIIAAVLSVLLHCVGMFYFADFRVNIVVATPEKMEQQVYETMKVFDVVKNPRKKIRKAGERVQDEVFVSSRDKMIETTESPVDDAKIAPPPQKDVALTSVDENMAKSTTFPDREEWQPRQEILEIHNKIAEDKLAVIPRRLTPKIERVPNAPDYVASVDMRKMGKAGQGGRMGSGFGRPAGSSMDHRSIESAYSSADGRLKAGNPRGGRPFFEESLTEITAVKPIERYLAATASVYAPVRDFRYGYFKIEIQRAGSDVLPVLPKDILFIQDSSSSITEQRLYFCRDGLQKCLGMMGAEDRFNVISFSDKSVRCFPDWQKNTKSSVEKAKGFISNLKSDGNTDIYASMQDVMKIKRDPSRPVLAFVITDGMANTGLTKSSNIIGEFSKRNKGAVSVFMMGTIKSANTYLLDLMGYSNKGGVMEAEGGRWGIPEAMQAGMTGISRPVMAKVKFRFAAGSVTEVYPLLASNLYLDRPMVLYGRYIKKGAKGIVFQAVGDAKDTRCDMVFDIPLGKNAPKGEKSIRTEWAKQKIYHLIGEYTRNPNPKTLKQIKTTAKMYKVDIPYEGKF